MQIQKFGSLLILLIFSFVSLSPAILAQDKKTFVKAAKFDKTMVPEPVLGDDKNFIELYYKAWEIAFNHIREDAGLPQSPYMDEAFDEGTIWIWDTTFMVNFCKYAPKAYPGIESLNNFYAPILDKKEIPLSIEIPDNPPLFAWTEYEYFKLTNDRRHLQELMLKNRYPQRHFDWFENVQPETIIARSAATKIKKVENGYLWEGGRSGMDNTPRGRTTPKALKPRPNNPKMLWIDAIAQQGLSALYISRLYEQLGRNAESQKWKAVYERIKLTVNRYYWDEQDGFYYDIDRETMKPLKIQTPASFWAMMAEISSRKQAAKMVAKVKDKNVFGGIVPWVTLARNDADFDKTGGYWRGGVWLPVAYMGIKSLQKYGYLDLAYNNAYSIISHMDKTYRQYSPHTIWECYNPLKPEPSTNEFGKIARKDFCGWSALGPISLLIENVLGFYDIDASTNTVKWHKVRKDVHGIKNLKFGSVVADIISSGNQININSNQPFTLIVNGKKLNVKAGRNQIFKAV